MYNSSKATDGGAWLRQDISVERLLRQDIPQLIGFRNDIVMVSDFGDMSLFAHPVRLKATIVLICLKGVIDCSINLRNYRITENHMLVNFTGDIIHISRAEDVAGYAIIISEEYLQKMQLDFRFRAQSYLTLRDNGPIAVPYSELADLKPYYTLLKKNMQDGNSEVIDGLALALSHTIIALMRRYQQQDTPDTERRGEARPQQLFEKFMRLLSIHHTRERSVQFYADKMFLTPKYISGVIKSYSGKSALDWINEYVVLEAKMMLRYTEMTIQEVSYALNFPTQSAFGKYFKQQMGQSPKQYRTTG